MGRGKQAFRLLQVAFVVAPIIAGLDKFFYYLTNWNQYLSPEGQQVLGPYVGMFFIIVGVVEIIVGLGNIWKPKIFSYILALWLLLIIINLILVGRFYDVALRDIGLFLAALAFARLSSEYSHVHTTRQRSKK